MSRKKPSFKSSLDMSAVLPEQDKVIKLRTVLLSLIVVGTVLLAFIGSRL